MMRGWDAPHIVSTSLLSIYTSSGRPSFQPHRFADRGAWFDSLSPSIGIVVYIGTCALVRTRVERTQVHTHNILRQLRG